MALGATVHRAELELADIDRGVYGSHTLTLARHPSETEERLMLRLLAWAMFADPDLEFGRGISTEEDPDLWLRRPDGTIALWIEVGLPEEKRLRRAAGRARREPAGKAGGSETRAARTSKVVLAKKMWARISPTGIFGGGCQVQFTVTTTIEPRLSAYCYAFVR